jgi:hypothetical protein
MSDDGRSYASRWFGVSIEDVVHYHSGICYSKVLVRTREAAEKVRDKVKHDTVNGGYLHGMPLGAITEMTYKDEKVFEVMV